MQEAAQQDKPFLNQTSFQLMLEENVRDSGITYIEAILEFCENNDMEFDQVKKLLTSNLKDKIKIDAIRDGMMRRESVLPLEEM